ncbi:ABC transporter permease [Acidicapsa acidisoli]|uniref:ABC transporter permease n=1 Tax=Acidicapsa acidisoli TaxID=1615681 RepID=UPI0021DFFB0F|nr:ABC transporter permease [Acidicapsa acidisoli]
MNWLKNLKSGLQSLLHKQQVDRELDEELASYLEASIADKQRSGMSPEAAHRAAHAEIGSRNSIKHQVWSSRWESTLDNLATDIRLSIRALSKSPGFTLVALLSLTLGIGANTAIFTLLNAILLRPLPVQNPQQLILFGQGGAIGSTDNLNNESWQLFSYPFYREFRTKSQSFSGIAALSSIQFGSHGSVSGGRPEQMRIDIVSGNYFSVFGVVPALGRTLAEADEGAPGSGPVAVISYAWWRRRFGGDPAVLGKTVRIEAHNYTIVGVAQPGFFGATVGHPADLWIPLSMEKEISPGWHGLEDRNFHSLFLIARLKPGETAEQASINTNLLFRQILRSDYAGSYPIQGESTGIQQAHIELTSAARGLSGLRRMFSLPLKILMTIVALVLLLACANIANMLLARGVTRAREVAVRMALGASRARIIVQLLTESALLALIGAAFGIALAWNSSALLLHLATPGETPVPIDLTPDLPVLAFTLLLTVLTALLFGVAPALRATRLELTPTLKEGRGSAPTSTRNTLARSLIVGQIALSLLLLTAAGLFLRSLLRLTSVDTGFDRNNVLVFGLDESAANLPVDNRLTLLQQQIEDRVQSLPGVQSASFSMFTFNEGQWSDDIIVQGIPRSPENSQDVLYNVVGSGFFKTFGLPLLAGRNFSAQDTVKSPVVAIINQNMARHFFPNQSAIGHHFGFGEDPVHSGDIEIIGVVKDAKYVALGEAPEMAAYFPYSQRIQYFSNFTVRYTGDPRPVIAAIRQSIAQINPNILVSTVSTLSEEVDRSIATQKLIAQLSAFFGALAVFLACIGIYGLLSYSVLRRTNEIGIRLALGAQSRALLWMILRESVVLLALGLAAGIPIALASTGILRNLLYQLSPGDPSTFAASVVIVTAMTLLAAWLPARRATKVDPMIALRCD